MKSIIAVSLLVTMASAWWDTGHLLTARIAQIILEKEDPETLQQSLNILQTLKETDPQWTNSEKDHPFTECATFADEIKYKGGSYQKGWHFIDEPFLSEGGKISDFNFTFDSHNITEVLKSLSDWFNQTDGYKDTYEYQQIMQHTYKDHSEKNGLSTAMRFLIHYTGDVHQPLHATSRVNHEYTKGDFGGNTVRLPNKEGASNLHAVWDSVIYGYTGHSKLPYTDSTWETLTNEAQTLMKNYPIDQSEAQNLDSRVWAHESFLVSQEVVYPSVHDNTALSADYIQKAKVAAEKRVVLGGHRLANTLMSFKLSGHDYDTGVAQKSYSSMVLDSIYTSFGY